MVDPVNQTVSYRGSATFTCTADGGPNNMFRWIKGSDTSALTGLMNTPLNVTDILDSLEYVASNYQLSLTDITGADDGGVYTCVVINEAGYDTASVTLYVSPEIILDPVDLFVEYGDSVNLTCEADSHPSPMYQWEKMNRMTAMFEAIEGENTTTLLFPSIEYEDYGRYRCVVTTPTIEETATSSDSLITGVIILCVQISTSIHTLHALFIWGGNGSYSTYYVGGGYSSQFVCVIVYAYSSPILREPRGVVFIQGEKIQILVPKEKPNCTTKFVLHCISKSKKACTSLKERWFSTMQVTGTGMIH